jgi:hypothetical protein
VLQILGRPTKGLSHDRTTCTETIDGPHFLHVPCPFNDNLPCTNIPQLRCAVLIPANHFLPVRRQCYSIHFTFPSHQSFPICRSLSTFHTRNEPFAEQVIIRRALGMFITSNTPLVCPSNCRRYVISGVFSFQVRAKI